MAEFHFRSMEASQNKIDVTIQFLVGGLVIQFAGIFHLSCSVQKLIQEFHVCAMVNFFLFLGANLTPKIFVQISTPPKSTTLRKSASIDEFWSRWLLPFGL
jgi:hypothetical protein